jgi:hypothetical protein
MKENSSTQSVPASSIEPDRDGGWWISRVYVGKAATMLGAAKAPTCRSRQ